jgi:16S rRNA processing protein RimM
MADPFVPLGEIVATHGLKGWLKVNPLNPATTALAPQTEVLIDRAGDQSIHEIETAHPHKRQWLIKLRGLDSIDDAARCVGTTLGVAESALEALAPGEYYHYQVVGFEVFSASGERIGTISSTLSTPGGELYVVQGAEKEHLIPAVKEIIDKVDFDAGTMIIDPPPGLLDL